MEVKKEYSPCSPTGTDNSIEDADNSIDVEDICESNSSAPEDEKQENKTLSHQQAMEQFKDALAEMIVGDPLLCDLHTEVTLEEIKSQIALEHGKAITVIVRRPDDIIYPVVIVHNATVHDLKKAIQRHVILRQARDNGIQHISWRYVWRSYWLYFNGQKLTEDSKLLRDYGISNKDEITFIKRIRTK